jgi:phage-related minor tail protein
MDIVTRAFTKTGDMSDDMTDTIIEYSTQFRELGLSAPKALGMIAQATAAGARNTDIAADAIKEFAILSKSGDATAANAFKLLGYNAEQMFQVFAAGGPGADKAMVDVLDRLKYMKDPVDQNTAAIGLFGTKVEDMGDALYALDPTTAVKTFGDIGDASKKMGDELAKGPAAKIEAMKRKVNAKLTDFAGEVIDTFDQLRKDPAFRKFAKTMYEDIMPALRGVGKAFKMLDNAAGDNRGEIRQVAKVFFAAEKIIGGLFLHALKAVIVAMAGVVRVGGGVIRFFNKAASNARKTKDAMFGMFDGIADGARAAVDEARNILDGLLSYVASVPGRTAKSAVKGLAKRIIGRHAAGGVVGAASGGARGGLIEVGEMGRELISVPGGSTVYNHSQTEQMFGGGGGGQVRVTFDVRGADSEFKAMIKKMVRVSGGGNVQVAFGKG